MPPYVAQGAGYTESRIPAQATPSTVQQTTTSVTPGKLTSGMWPVWIMDSVEDNDEVRAYHALVPKRTVEEEEAEEREWDSIVSKPHVRQALRRMAAEARQQYYAGETEEGGFGLE